ncbi:hypothetical protein VTJ83DRAFT_5340 [Remersonia thermophila]|uniref:L domain-like protein n=1 Tax=Remersonia thermophila TaxID=72144 RepID=A0ABR4D6J2_9PEZI
MDGDTRQPRPSGIPRPSKIPQPSRLPIPRTPSLRTSRSRDTLDPADAADASSGLRNPKLRTTPSRDHLTARAPAVAQASLPFRAVSSPPARTSSLGRTPASSTASAAATTPQPLRVARGAPAATPGLRSSSSAAHSLRRQSSHPWISAAVLPHDAQEDAANGSVPGDSGPLSPLSPKSSRLSLAERTVETLSRLPSSPAVKGRAAASFYGADAAPWKLSSRSSSRASNDSRPGSRSGPDDRLQAFALRPLSPIEGTPPLRNQRSVTSLPTPSAKTLSARSSRTSLYGLPPPSVGASRAASPSLDRHLQDGPQPAPKTLAPRAPTKRPSVNGLSKKPSTNGLSKKPSTSALNKGTGMPRKTSVVSHSSSSTSLEGTGSSVASGSTGITGDSEPGQSYKKASAALREQIAKARAAKRAAAAAQPASSDDAAAFPDAARDFELCADPFNQHRDDKSLSKVLKSRLETARTSGRLNIAALGLKEIPSDVLNMYNLEYIGDSGGAWAESVDLTRFVAADNELEMISDAVFPDVDPQVLAEDDDGQGNIFAGLETLDLHGNILVSLPMGLRRLSLLTSLNLSLNRLSNNCLEVICQVTSLKDLKLAGNLLFGSLDPCLAQLENLEILDLHGNNLSSIPPEFARLSRLRILNISENGFEQLPFDILARLPLTELVARKNQLQGTLLQDGVDSLPRLQVLDVSSNQLAYLCSSGKLVSMPALHQLCVSVNRLQALPNLGGCSSLVTLAAEENNINAIPEGFVQLGQLRSADFSSNDIRVIPNEIGLMEKLVNLRLSGNPLREKKISSMTTEEIKTMLAQRLEPADDAAPPEAAEPTEPVPPVDDDKPTPLSSTAATVAATATQPQAQNSQIDDDDDDDHSDLDRFLTPPTSAPASPAPHRSQSQTADWPVKPGGVLDRSNTQSSSLHPVICSKLAASHMIGEIQLHHNLFAALPDSLTFFAETLTALSLAYNQLVGETYLVETLDLPALEELNLSHNHITGLGPLVGRLKAPKLSKLDVSFNRLSALPGCGSGTATTTGKLRDAFPALTVLLASNNHLMDLEPEAIAGLRVVDVENNDIAHLNPRIGLLGAGGPASSAGLLGPAGRRSRGWRCGGTGSGCRGGTCSRGAPRRRCGGCGGGCRWRSWEGGAGRTVRGMRWIERIVYKSHGGCAGCWLSRPA